MRLITSTFLFFFFFSWTQTSASDKYRVFLRNIFPQGVIKEYSSPFRYFKIISPGFEGWCVFSADVCPQMRCFRDHINILVALGPHSIRFIKVYSSQEDPGYFGPDKYHKFFNQFQGKSILEEFSISKNIDGISGATISSSCATRIINCVLDKMRNKVLKSPPSVKSNLSFSPDLVMVVILILFSIFSYLKHRPFWRDISLFFNLLYFGFWKGYFLNLVSIRWILSLNLKHFLYATPLSIYIFFAILSSFIGARFFCGWLCPFGGIMHFLNKINIFKRNPNFTHNRHLLNLKVIILAILIIFYLSKINFSLPLPFFPYFNFLNFPEQTKFLIFLILLSLYIPYFWCRYLCPVGGFLSVLGAFALRKYKFTCKDISCKICIKKCPVGVIDSQKKVLDNNCIRCNACKDCAKS